VPCASLLQHVLLCINQDENYSANKIVANYVPFQSTSTSSAQIFPAVPREMPKKMFLIIYFFGPTTHKLFFSFGNNIYVYP
jgi:hypothetical protein